MRTLGKACLILLPLAIVGMRMHARATSNPVEMTREVNRSLSIVNAAARTRGRRSTLPPAQAVPAGLLADSQMRHAACLRVVAKP